MKNFTDKIINKLNLPEKRKPQISLFLSMVSYYRLLPYIEFIKNNPEITAKLPDCKDCWDAIVYLYRYNIKLSSAIYPYIYLLETILKTRVNNLFCSTFGIDWYKNKTVLSNFNNRSINYLKNQIQDYLDNVKTPDIMDFVENHTTFGYWVAIVESGNYWNSKNIKIRKLFSANETINTATLSIKEINKKLRSINDLRNCISHHNRIIGCIIDRKGYSNFKLWDIYRNIIEIFHLLGCNDENWMIGDINCCQKGSLEGLYKELEFVHQYEIKPQKDFVQH
jgi:hypothetical protein